MATKEKTTETVEIYDPWKDMRAIKLPRAPKGEENFVYVAVNGVAKQVPRGKSVVLPYPLYEALMDSQAAQDALDEYRDEIPNER